MRIVFCGTPDYAVPSLKALYALQPRHSVVAVVSQPDKPKGRSNVPTPPPVVEAARALGVPQDRILQPKSINRRSVLEQLRSYQPDLLWVIAYGNILKSDALALARLFPLNAHGSILPKYRGASPIQAALLNGDAESGVSIMKMEAGLDTGPVLFTRTTPLSAADDAGTLHDRLAELSAACLVEALERIEAGPVSFTPQNDAEASHTAKLDKNSGQIDWSRPATTLFNFVRAMNPWPGAWTHLALPDGSQGLRLRVARAALEPAASLHAPNSTYGMGELRGSGDENVFLVTCGAGTLSVSSVQPEGKRAMSVSEFVRGAGRKFVPKSQWK